METPKPSRQEQQSEAIKAAIGIRVGDQVTFKLPGQHRAGIGTVRRILMEGDAPRYEVAQGNRIIATLPPECIE
jgi:predicted lysophospholipase L1 biosynthesis ABC-type transport system permease subunit